MKRARRGRRAQARDESQDSKLDPRLPESTNHQLKRAPHCEAALDAVLTRREACPETCNPIHVLEIGKYGPISEEEYMRRERTMPPADFDAWHEAHNGTRCTLCGNFVHFATWKTYTAKRMGVDPSELT